ncbi:MAG: LamG domain-containing protein, partial [candidate division WS1 bacterium]|nr:LamG domain-containing protein [candidate division WS1 bacterium]
MDTRWLLLAAFALLLGSIGALCAQPLPAPVFYLSFDEGNLAHLKGNLAHRFSLDSQYFHEGKFGRSYRFEPPYANLLPPEQASPAPSGFTAGEGVKLTFNGSPPVLTATGQPGVLWQTTPIELDELPHYPRPTKSFLAAVYLRSQTPGTKIRLELTDDLEATDWQQPILDANAAALKKNPEAKVTEPLASKPTPQEVELTDTWQRVTAGLTVDARRTRQALSVKLTLLTPAAAVEAQKLQLEQIDVHPHSKNYAGPWIPGGESRPGNTLSILLRNFDFSGQRGTMSCWVRFPAPEGGGSRGGHFLSAGSGWWNPMWVCGTYSTYLGDVGKVNFKAGQGTFHNLFRPTSDGAWHHIALTWENETCGVFLDGQEVARSAYLPADPVESTPLRIGGSTLEGAVSSAFVDEVALWDAALPPTDLQSLATAPAPLRDQLPTCLVERPDRLLFHRGEATAPLPLTLVTTTPRGEPVNATLTIPDLGLHQPLTLKPDQEQTVALQPWLVSPGKYPLRLESNDATLKVATTLEVVPSLPLKDFTVLGWGSGSDIAQMGFTAELGSDPEPSMRRGLLLAYRWDARRWHPLDPAILPASLASAESAGRRVAPYPHILSALLNTEVGISTPPSAPWFTEWLKKSTGLDSPPPEVHYNPFLITGPPDSPALLPAEDPAYRFTQWFLRQGKGWPVLHKQVAQIMRDQGVKDTLFFTDQPQTPTDWEGLDLADYWHYPHVPSGLVADFSRVTCLARLAGKQIQLTPGTIFWDPWPMHVDDKIVLLSPDLMREYLWITVANPLDRMGLYGWGELRKGFVLPGFKETLKETVATLYPLGLLTGGLPPGPVPVAYLETDGQYWQGPGDNAWIQFWFNRQTTRSLAEARLRYDWIGDDHVRAGWLKNYSAVVMLGAHRVPEPIHRELVRYAQAGGLVVTDKRCRAEIPGATVLDIPDRAQRPETVAALQTWAQEFRAQHPAPLRLADTDQAWLYEKLDGPARFIFIINDLRKPGALGDTHKLTNNFGTHSGPLQDQGDEQTVSLTLPSVAGQVLYDLRRHVEVPLPAGQPLQLNLASTDAAVLALLPARITRLRTQAPGSLPAGTEGLLRLAIVTEAGTPIQHRDVIELRATDAAGNAVDLNRYFRVTNGRLDLPLRLPRD